MVSINGFNPLRRTYFITRFSRRGEEFPHFPEVPNRVVALNQPIDVQRYVDSNIVDPAQFQISGGKLSIAAFGREDVRCLYLLAMTIAHINNDGKHIKCSLLYYADSFVHEPRCNRWSTIFL